MYTNILVALSSTQIAKSEYPIIQPRSVEQESLDISREVFDEAISLAKSFRANLTLLHTISEREIQKGIREFGSEEKFEQEYQRQLRLLEKEASDEGVDIDQISFQVISGDPKQRICEHARHWNNDLIVVGRREKHSPLGMGSVSKHVISNAPCTVFVINPRESITSKGTHPATVH